MGGMAGTFEAHRKRVKTYNTPGHAHFLTFSCHRFWQKGPGHDKNIGSIEKAVEKACYCHHNPVTQRLVKDPAQWRWSSFRWLELGEKTNAPLEVEEWDERLLEEES